MISMRRDNRGLGLECQFSDFVTVFFVSELGLLGVARIGLTDSVVYLAFRLLQFPHESDFQKFWDCSLAGQSRFVFVRAVFFMIF
jgi:hypothetical protein